jgi:hypothetical protein
MEQPVACRAEDDQIGESGHHRTLWPAAEWRLMVHLKAPIPTDAKCASKVRAARLTDSFGRVQCFATVYGGAATARPQLRRPLWFAHVLTVSDLGAQRSDEVGSRAIGEDAPTARGRWRHPIEYGSPSRSWRDMNVRLVLPGRKPTVLTSMDALDKVDVNDPASRCPADDAHEKVPDPGFAPLDGPPKFVAADLVSGQFGTGSVTTMQGGASR